MTIFKKILAVLLLWLSAPRLAASVAFFDALNVGILFTFGFEHVFSFLCKAIAEMCFFG